MPAYLYVTMCMQIPEEDRKFIEFSGFEWQVVTRMWVLAAELSSSAKAASKHA